MVDEYNTGGQEEEAKKPNRHSPRRRNETDTLLLFHSSLQLGSRIGSFIWEFTINRFFCLSPNPVGSMQMERVFNGTGDPDTNEGRQDGRCFKGRPGKVITQDQDVLVTGDTVTYSRETRNLLDSETNRFP